LKTPFQLQFVGVFALASWGFFYLLPTDVAAHSPRARRKEIICFIGGLCLCMAATLTMSNGLLTWPVAFFAGLVGRLSMRKLTIIAITGISVWATYFHDFQFPPGHSPPSDTINSLCPIIEYVSIYLGHPLSPHWPEYASAIGLAGIALAMILFSTALMDQKRNIFKDRYSTTLTLIIMFILGTAIATALGRVEFGLTQAASGRYATPALIFWLAMCAICIVAYQAAKRYRLFWLVGGTFLGTLMVSSVIVSQSNFWELGEDWRNTKKQAATAILAEVYAARASHDVGAVHRLHRRRRRGRVGEGDEAETPGPAGLPVGDDLTGEEGRGTDRIRVHVGILDGHRSMRTLQSVMWPRWPSASEIARSSAS